MAASVRKIGVVAGALGNDLRAVVRLAREAGFAGIQLDPRMGSLDVAQLSRSGLREVGTILRSHDLELVSLRADLGGLGLGPKADVQATIDRLSKLMEAAAQLQAPLLCVDAGPLPTPVEETPPTPEISPIQAGAIIMDIPPTLPEMLAAPPTAKTPPRPFDAAMAASVDGALAELGRRADRYGVMVAMRSDLAGFAALERAINAAACPWFGVDLDPVALLHDEWTSDEMFSRIGKYIRHVRGRDAVRGADRRTRPAVVGQGSVEWEALTSDLDDVGYHGWLTIDPIDLSNRPAAAAGGAQHLRNIGR